MPSVSPTMDSKTLNSSDFPSIKSVSSPGLRLNFSTIASPFADKSTDLKGKSKGSTRNEDTVSLAHPDTKRKVKKAIEKRIVIEEVSRRLLVSTPWISCCLEGLTPVHSK
jgi:hypothetical protein